MPTPREKPHKHGRKHRTKSHTRVSNAYSNPWDSGGWGQPPDLGLNTINETPDPVNPNDPTNWFVSMQTRNEWPAGDKPTDVLGGEVWDRSTRLDRIRDSIPFWQRGVRAAEEGGEVEKMEDFLEQVEKDRKENGEKMNADLWWHPIDPEDWGPPLEDDAWGPRDPLASEWQRPWETGPNPAKRVTADDEWLEQMARIHGAEDRLEEMQQFFSQMPTQDKVKKIEDLVDFLRTHQR